MSAFFLSLPTHCQHKFSDSTVTYFALDIQIFTILSDSILFISFCKRFVSFMNFFMLFQIVSLPFIKGCSCLLFWLQIHTFILRNNDLQIIKFLLILYHNITSFIWNYFVYVLFLQDYYFAICAFVKTILHYIFELLNYNL